MTTLDELVAITGSDQPYTLQDPDPLVALSHLHAVARARAVQLGAMDVADVQLATTTVLKAVDLALDHAQPARELPAVYIDSDADIILGVQDQFYDDKEGAIAVACRDLLRDATMIGARCATDDIERVRDFLDAAIRARRDHETAVERIRTEHATAINALRAAGWTVREP